MTNEEIIKKAIDRAAKNGWCFYGNGEWLGKQGIIDFANAMMKYDGEYPTYYRFIFSHSFAQAFWGEEEHEDVGVIWKHELTEMVLEEEPILYLKKFL